jgi:predicted RNA binding protein YcfA (HicA-like mRNA interferase family)
MGGKSACPVNKPDRLKFLRDNGFHFSRMGNGSHEIWAYQETGETVTVCRNPAKGTWRHVEKQVKAITEKQHKTEMVQDPAAKQKAKEENSLRDAFKRTVRRAFKTEGAKAIGFTFQDFKKYPDYYRNAAYK